MLQSISSVFIVYRRKTLTGSPDPTHANGTDKPCMNPSMHWGSVAPLGQIPLPLGRHPLGRHPHIWNLKSFYTEHRAEHKIYLNVKKTDVVKL